MHYAHAALAGTPRVGEKLRHLGVRLVAVHAVQVDVILDAPATTPEVAQKCPRQATAQERVSPPKVEPVIDGQGCMQQFGNDRRFVQLPLTWLWAGLRPLEADPVGPPQRRRAGHGGAQSVYILGAGLLS